MEFSSPEYWSRLPIPSPVGFPDPGIKLVSPEFQADSLPSELPGKPLNFKAVRNIVKILNFYSKRCLTLHLPAMHNRLLLSELQTSWVLSHLQCKSHFSTSGEVHPRRSSRGNNSASLPAASLAFSRSSEGVQFEYHLMRHDLCSPNTYSLLDNKTAEDIIQSNKIGSNTPICYNLSSFNHKHFCLIYCLKWNANKARKCGSRIMPENGLHFSSFVISKVLLII